MPSPSPPLVQTGMMQRVLVIGAERLTQLLDWAKRDTAVLFGDGAGAVIIEASEQESGLIASKLGCDSEAREILHVPNFGTDRVRFADIDGLFTFNFEGQEIFKRAVRGMGETTGAVLAQAGIAPEQVDLIVPHQANVRIIETLAKRMNAAMDKVMVNIEQYGNTSAATVPIALCEALEQGRVKPNSYLLTAAFRGRPDLGCRPHQVGRARHPRPCATTSCHPASRAPWNSSPMRCRAASGPQPGRLMPRQSGLWRGGPVRLLFYARVYARAKPAPCRTAP